MESLYDLLIWLSQRHEKINGKCWSDNLRFDLEKKNIKSGKFYLMENNQWKYDTLKVGDKEIILKGLPQLPKNLREVEPWEYAEKLYEEYKYSSPFGQTGYGKSNFRACTSDELSFEQLLLGKNRVEAMCALEAFILLGNLPWEEENHWYRKGKDPWFVVYKSWIV